MKTVTMKKWILALAVTGASASGFAAPANSSSTVTSERTSVIETTRETSSNTGHQHSNATLSREEVVEFKEDSMALSKESQLQLENLVQTLDKSKPVAVTVEIQENSEDAPASAAAADRVTSTEPGATTPTSEQPSVATRANPATTVVPTEVDEQPVAQTLGQQRADSVRQFLQDKGVDVVEWTVEGTEEKQSISVTRDDQPIREAQQLRIVITGEGEEGLSAL